MSWDLILVLKGNYNDIVAHLDTGLACVLYILINMFKCTYCRFFKQYLLLLLVNQMSSALFRSIAAMGRNMIIANTFGSFALLLLFALGGFILAKGNNILN